MHSHYGAPIQSLLLIGLHLQSLMTTCFLSREFSIPQLHLPPLSFCALADADASRFRTRLLYFWFCAHLYSHHAWLPLLATLCPSWPPHVHQAILKFLIMVCPFIWAHNFLFLLHKYLYCQYFEYYPADGSSSLTHHGSCAPTSYASGHFTMPFVLHVPILSLNIFTISQLMDHNSIVSFASSSFYMKVHCTMVLIGWGHWQYGIYFHGLPALIFLFPPFAHMKVVFDENWISKQIQRQSVPN